MPLEFAPYAVLTLKLTLGSLAKYIVRRSAGTKYGGEGKRKKRANYYRALTSPELYGSIVAVMSKLVSLNSKIRKDQHELLRKQAFFRQISMAAMLRLILDDNSYLKRKHDTTL